MGKASSPARRRGSSAGKASRSSGKQTSGGTPRTEKLPAWDEDALPSPKNAADRAAYGELLTRYDGLPDRVKHKLIKSELTGKAFDLRMSDIVPTGALKLQISGELYAELQSELDKNPAFTSLDFMRVLLRSPKLPMSTRFDVAKEMLPYEHPRNPTPPPRDGERRAALVIPGAVSLEDWERLAAEHRDRVKQLERLQTEE